MSRANESHPKKQDQGEGSATDHLRDAAAQVGQQVRDVAGQYRDEAREQYDHLRQQASDYYDQGRQQAAEWQDSLESYVQEKPVKALLIAAGVGMLLGVLWKRS
ncbi:MAG TPA: hypothetical protein VFE58_01420 [Tepidisphaeraceae bacterium]|jgi:ElaB/YqjD/DUF883 family membrane-anchored ribosome-binding protein|nr:hypothetical protein [Tepidisphaeraceae bacterium]